MCNLHQFNNTETIHVSLYDHTLTVSSFMPTAMLLMHLLLLLLLLLLHAEIRVTLSHKNVTGAPYRIIVNAANSPQWLMSVAKGVTE